LRILAANAALMAGFLPLSLGTGFAAVGVVVMKAPQAGFAAAYPQSSPGCMKWIVVAF
jgi:hypothetical protein